MSNFKGYLLKFGNYSGNIGVFPNEYIARGAEATPCRRTDAKAYRDANNDLHRMTIPNHKSTFAVTTIPGLTLEQKEEIEAIMACGLISEIKRKYYVEYWCDDIGVNDYKTGYFYIPDTTFKRQKIGNGTIVYDALTYEFIEY